jgi:phosphonate degradation associated HDIG domain protein
MNFIEDIERIYLEHGTRLYEIKGRGNGVTQLQHALQCAWLAAEAGAADTLVAAALLHDIGHLLYDRHAEEMVSGHDDMHQYMALPFLRPHLPPAVLEPIRLHVDAKRCLCGTEPDYRRGLSEGSRRSLELQGGPFDAAQAQAFMALDFANDALQLRRWDDQAKDPQRRVPAFYTYQPLLARLNLKHPPAPAHVTRVRAA